MQITKNRNRKEYSFANINLLGNCNANCYFCLGKDIQEELKGTKVATGHEEELIADLQQDIANAQPTASNGN